MSDEDLKAIHNGIGSLLREIAQLSTGHSNLHVKVDQLGTMVRRYADKVVQTAMDTARAHRRINALERQVAIMSERPEVPNWHPDPREITGTHQYETLKAQQDDMLAKQLAEEERRRDSGIWWRRQRVQWAFLIVAAVFSASMAGCVGYIAYRVQSIEKSASDKH